MNKLSKQLLTAALALAGGAFCTVTNSKAATIGYWRLENDATNSVVANGLNGTVNGGTFTSLDTAGPMIFDPVSGQTYTNTYSYDASGANARTISIADNALFTQSSFTWEMYIKVVGQPASYDSFLTNRQSVTVDSINLSKGYQIDFDGNTGAGNSSFGRLRSRFDIPLTSTLSTNPHQNQVASFTGSYLYTDDDGPGTADVLNNDTSWHHIALTYDGTAIRVYLDGVAGGSRTLVGTFEEAMASVVFGKTSSANYGLLIDEVRFSSGVLTADQFLKIVPEPTIALQLMLGAGALLLRRRRATRSSEASVSMA